MEAITLCSGQNPRPAPGGKGPAGPPRLGFQAPRTNFCDTPAPRAAGSQCSRLPETAVQGGHLLPQTYLLGSSMGETPWNVSVCSKVN